jgi:hypothetical protein
VSIIESLVKLGAMDGEEQACREMVLPFLWRLERARAALPGHTLRYEDLTADPAGCLRDLCGFLEVDWEPGMLDYSSRADENHIPRYLGDTSENIYSGGVRRGRILPRREDIPEELLPMCRTWSYM